MHTFNSYAKINLYLQILGKRKDSYHNLKTIFERISLCDKIILKRRRDKKVTVSCNAAGVPTGSDNLAWRSAKLLQDKFDIDKGVDIKIIKRIPPGSGLGGGSSNAATLLLGLNRLWRLKLTRDKLAALAKRIGCDVPFFIYNTPFALGEGRGDKIRPLEALKDVRLWHILVIPKIAVSTPFIYKKWDERKEKARLTRPKYDVNMLPLALEKNDRSLIKEALFNSLEQITARFYPQINSVKDKLVQLGIKSILMSGSGPAVFGVVSSRKEALSLSRQLKLSSSLNRVFVVRTR